MTPVNVRIIHLPAEPCNFNCATAGRRQLQLRALALVKSKVQQVLRHAAQQVSAAVAEHAGSSGGTPGMLAQQLIAVCI